MSTITTERLRAFDSRRWLERLLALEFSVDTEVLVWTGIMAAAVVLHFWDLGSRALHHDESLHAVYSFYLYKGEGYKHDPLMHGPVLFHLTALMYLLFGVTNATARFSAAFAGTALVFTPFFLRRWIGRWGAIAAALLLLLSPTALYYSRFLREDIFVALWTAGLFIGVWRYLQSRRPLWLYVAAACLALDFANKEITYMFAGILLVYTDALLAAELSPAVARRLFRHAGEPSWGERMAAFALIVPVAWAVAVLWNPLARRRERLGLTGALPVSGDLLVIIGTLTLPQLSALITVPFKHFGHPLAAASYVGEGPLTAQILWGGLVQTIALLLVASAIAGIAWNRRRWLITAAIFYAIYLCLYTTFFTNIGGIASGMWGSLSYWTSQQGVKRGNQPVFYYLMLLPTYEYVALAFALIGIVAQAVRHAGRSLLWLACCLAMVPLIAITYSGHNLRAAPFAIAALAFAVAAAAGNSLRQLLIVWFGGLLFALSVSGEKMPWLNLHLTLPLTLLAGMAINELLNGALAAWRPDLRRLLALLAGAAAAGAIIMAVLAWGPGSDGVHVGLVGLALLGVVAAAIAAGRAWSVRVGAALGGALLLGLLAPLSIHTAMDLSFVHGDTPYDMLVYTQTSPDLPKIMQDVAQYARQSGRGLDQPIVVDANDAFTWPWAWYLRDYRSVSYVDLSAYLNGQGGFTPAPGAIVLVNNVDRAIMSQFPGQFGTGVPYHHRWWFPEDYRGTTAPGLVKSLALGTTWARWWGFLAAHQGIVLPGAPVKPGQHQIGTVDATAYFPANYRPGVGIMTNAATSVPAPTTAANGALTVGGPGSQPGAFLHPAGIAVDSAGNFYVVDTQNNRIEKFDANGRFLLASNAGAAGYGSLRQPWGITVDRQGMVYVADTWNHRIVKFDSQLRFVQTWGYPIRNNTPDSLLSLYGPREIAIEPSGNLLVTDTGNSRVVEYTPQGQPLTSFGTRGSGPGQFQEPVGLAVAPDGTIYVADTWNARIDVFSAAKQYLRSLPVNGWESHSIENKPYLALLPNGNLLFSQPDSDRLVEMTPAGVIVKNDNTLGAGLTLARPLGVAAAPDGSIYVSDSLTNKVTREPLAALP